VVFTTSSEDRELRAGEDAAPLERPDRDRQLDALIPQEGAEPLDGSGAGDGRY